MPGAGVDDFFQELGLILYKKLMVIRPMLWTLRYSGELPPFEPSGETSKFGCSSASKIHWYDLL